MSFPRHCLFSLDSGQAQKSPPRFSLKGWKERHWDCEKGMPTFFFFSLFFEFIIYLLSTALGLRCCRGFSLTVESEGSSLVVVYGFPIVVAFHCDGFSCCRGWALGTQASVVVVHWLSCLALCGIFLDQRLNLCPLHWQMES